MSIDMGSNLSFEEWLSTAADNMIIGEGARFFRR